MGLIGLLVLFVVLYNPQDKIIGGDGDEHGCLAASTGYTYNESVNACIREWDLNENQRRAARIAVDSVEYELGLTVVQVAVARCPGCFMVELEKGRDRIKITLENWGIKEVSLTPEECLDLGGKAVNVVGGANCYENETNFGEVAGFISPNICCVPK